MEGQHPAKGGGCGKAGPPHIIGVSVTGHQGGNKVGELEKEQRLESEEPSIQPKYPKALGGPWEYFIQDQTYFWMITLVSVKYTLEGDWCDNRQSRLETVTLI